MEIMRGCAFFSQSSLPACSSWTLARTLVPWFMHSVWQRYDAFTGHVGTGGSGSARVCTVISALKRLVTKRPALPVISMQMRGIGEPANDTPAVSVFPYSTPAGLRCSYC
jgi:hypothetical protein